VDVLAEATSSAKQELYHLVDSLPLQEIAAAKRFLEFLLFKKDEDDPVFSAFLDAPEVDEPLDPLETAELRESMREITQGETRSWDEVKKELGHL
jgi:hypothetical protein